MEFEELYQQLEEKLNSGEPLELSERDRLLGLAAVGTQEQKKAFVELDEKTMEVFLESHGYNLDDFYQRLVVERDTSLPREHINYIARLSKGMWIDREDTRDSVQWVRNLREGLIRSGEGYDNIAFFKQLGFEEIGREGPYVTLNPPTIPDLEMRTRPTGTIPFPKELRPDNSSYNNASMKLLMTNYNGTDDPARSTAMVYFK